jgi:glycosyltransferase involved in cell wall biosynthesis
MKLLFVAPRFHTNQFFVVKALLAHGHEVAFHAVFEGKSEDHSLLSPTPIPQAALYRRLARYLGRADDHDFEMKYMVPALGRYWAMLKAERPDVVIVRNPTHVSSFTALLMARLLGIKPILYTQGPKHYAPSLKKRLFIASALSLFRAAWITPVKGDARPGTATHRHLYYLPFVVEPEPEPKTEWFRGGAVHLLCIGKFFPRKNHLLLLKALEPLRERYAFRVTLVGECSSDAHRRQLERIRAYLDESRMGELVTIKTNLPFAEVQALYRAHDLFVLPSAREPAGVSLLEAMGKGLPVVCSTSNGTRWYVEEGVNGHVFRSDDLQDLRRVLEQLLADRDGIIRMGRESLRLADTVHHPETYYRQLDRILRERFGVALEPARAPAELLGSA